MEIASWKLSVIVAMIVGFVNVCSDTSSGSSRLCNTQTSSGLDGELENFLGDLALNVPHGYLHGLKMHNGCRDTRCGYKDLYGHGKCIGTLSDGACWSCLTVAKEELRNGCKNSDGGQVRLDNCWMRYETYDFTDD